MNTQHFDFESILKDAGRLYQHPSWQADCPSDGTLHDLVYAELSPEISPEVNSHVKTCQSCRMRVLTLQTERDQFNRELDEAYHVELAHLRHSSKFDYTLPGWKVKEYYYDVEEARVVNSAFSKTFEKTCPLSTQAGNITLDIQWGHQEEPAGVFLWMQWEADFPPEQGFAIRFTELETEEIVFQVMPDNFAAAGQRMFEPDDLPFDPTTISWKPGVVLLERETL